VNQLLKVKSDKHQMKPNDSGILINCYPKWGNLVM